VKDTPGLTPHPQSQTEAASMPTIVDFPTVVKAALDVFGDLFANERVNRTKVRKVS
jgi:hypothetical protein